jgi:hypothetical protein
MLKTLPENPSQITPAIRATLPAFQLVQNRERSPEPERRKEPEVMRPDDESLAELEAPEELYMHHGRTRLKHRLAILRSLESSRLHPRKSKQR